MSSCNHVELQPCRVATVSSCNRVQFATVSSWNRRTVATVYSRSRVSCQFCSCRVETAHSCTRIESTRRAVHLVSDRSVSSRLCSVDTVSSRLVLSRSPLEAGASLVTPEELPFAAIFVQNSTILEQILLPCVSYLNHSKKFHGMRQSICQHHHRLLWLWFGDRS